MSIATSTLRPSPQPAEGAELARRFAASARALDGLVISNADFDSWFTRQRLANRFEVTPIPFDRLRGWHLHPGSGDLVHDSGKFFRIEGLRVGSDFGGRREWSQPIINQPEIGILGILVKEIDGVLHLLMQAKMEPGNINTVQLSPTVQATRSNYNGVHGGRGIPYLTHFVDRSAGTVVADVLQSEQGSWFLRKRNRNMIVEVTGDLPEHADFCWLTLGQVNRLMRLDNVVNMDTRSVLSCMPFLGGGDEPLTDYGRALHRSLEPDSWALHGDEEILHWITGLKSRHELVQQRVPLSRVEEWRHGTHAIEHQSGRFFRVIAAEIAASNREVPSWTQPLLEPVGPGVVAFLTRRIYGVLHILVHARSEAGALDVVELGPSVQYQPSNYGDLATGSHPRFSGTVLSATPDRRRYDTLQSEEGGRFKEAESRYQVIEVGEECPLDEPEQYAWVTPRQVMGLLKHGYYLNVQARSLFASLLSIA